MFSVLSPRPNPVMEPDIEIFAAAYSITDLISSLQFSFRKTQFDSVAAVLEEREDLLKRNIMLLMSRVETQSDMERKCMKILQDKVEFEVELLKYMGICQNLRVKHGDLEEKIEKVSKKKFEIEVKLRHSMCECDHYKGKMAELEKKFNELLEEKLEAEVAASKYKADCEGHIGKYTDLEKKMEKIVLEKLYMEVDAEKRLAHNEEKLTSVTENFNKVNDELRVLLDKEKSFANFIIDLKKEKDEEIKNLRKEIARLSDDLNKEKSDNKEEVFKLNEEIRCMFEERNEALELAKNWEDKWQQCQPRLIKLEQDLAAFLHSNPVMTRTLTGPYTQMLAGDQAASPESPASGPNPSDVARGNRIPIQNPDLLQSGPKETAINHVIEIDSDDDTPVINLDDTPVINLDDMPVIGTATLKESKDRKRPQCNNDGGTQYKKGKVNSPSADMSKTDEDGYSSDESISEAAINKLINQIRKENRFFTSEADMLSEFNKDDEFCMNAVCALYRQQKSVEHLLASNDLNFNATDATRGNALAEFVINGDPQGKPQRSLNELEQHNPEGPKHCRRIARNHLKQLYEIYQKGKDPFFHHPI